MFALSASSYALSEAEVAAGAALCPTCGERAYIDWDDDDAPFVACFCGFTAAGETVTNLPPGWVSEARRDDAREEAREAVAELALSAYAPEREVGAAMLESLGASDWTRLAELLDTVAGMPGRGDQQAVAALRRALGVLQPEEAS